MVVHIMSKVIVLLTNTALAYPPSQPAHATKLNGQMRTTSSFRTPRPEGSGAHVLFHLFLRPGEASAYAYFRFFDGVVARYFSNEEVRGD